MNDPVITLEPVEPKKAGFERRLIGLFVLLLLFIGSLAFFTVAPHVKNQPVATAVNTDALQEQINSLNTRLQAVETRAEAIKENPAAENAPVNANDGNVSTRFSRMQNDIESLSTALSAMQTETKAKEAIAAEAREATTTQIGELLTFIPLREAINSGRGFANELAAMRDQSKKDAELQASLIRLENFAGNGVPTLTMLHDELVQRESAVSVAVAKGAAQNWWQRIVAQLQSLVTVRSSHDAHADTLAQLETALAKGNSATAMDAFKALPNDAQQNLAGWQQQLAARQETEEALAAIISHFTQATVKAP